MGGDPCADRRIPGGLRVTAAFAVLITGFVLSCVSADLEWENHGGGLHNRRYAEWENKINPWSVRGLNLKWSVFTNSDVTATPSVKDDVVYVPTWDGSLYAAHALTGAVLWKKNLTAISGLPLPVVLCRTTPTIAGDLLLLGIYTGAYLVAVNRFTGDFVWSSLLDPHPYAGVTMSGTVFLGAYYVGTTSKEETRTTGCCTFIGSFLKIDVATGHVLWRTTMLPPNGNMPGQYAGSAVWGSSPAVDPVRNLVYIATGNSYSSPPHVVACELAQQKLGAARAIPDPCIEPGDHSESVLALDLATGRIVWADHLGGYDTFVIACISSGNPNCPPIPGPDFDFGQAPMLLRGVEFAGPGSAGVCAYRDLVVVAQKSGFVFALSADDGSKIWTKVAGPGGFSGGAMWGSASDGKTVYVAIVNSLHLNYTLVPSNRMTTGGAWVALDAATGAIRWSTPSPDVVNGPTGPVSLANGVLFGTTHSAHGKLYALDAATGDILWTHTPNGSVLGGFSIVDGCAYVGEGSSALGGVTPGKYFYGFCV